MLFKEIVNNLNIMSLKLIFLGKSTVTYVTCELFNVSKKGKVTLFHNINETIHFLFRFQR